MRGGISHNNGSGHFETFKVDTATQNIAKVSGATAVEGKAVTLTANDEVGFGTDNAIFFGIIEKYEDDGYAGVQDGGYKVNVPAVSGSVPGLGAINLVVNGAGSVKTSGTVVSNGRVVSSDTTTNKITVLIG